MYIYCFAKLVSIHKQLKMKLEEARFLQNYIQKNHGQNKNTNAQAILNESEEEYDFDEEIEAEN